ncbi:hypothetical protein BDZ94DRAFT_1260278 [Collybia nuda]|uniref:F-box domain-containing protein n=1 Tax=Collybia nuda TaxID=64659 RepID=A0A9P6CEK6_9AGAR|nr:hypothetical protein BDZ94DRAFT_1260278 [Collybia nuda]
MSALPSFSALPAELLSDILLLLDIPDLLTCHRLSRPIHSLISHSIALQYNLELFTANLVDGPPSHSLKSVRLRSLRDHQRAWNDVKWSDVHDIVLTQDEMSPELSAWELVGGIFAVAVGRHLRFIQLPSALRDVPTREWSIPDIGFTMKDFAMDRSQDLLVVIELSDPAPDSKFLRFHLRRLSNGTPHPRAHDPVITYGPTTVNVADAWHVVQIYSDYVVIMLQALTTLTSEVIFWNWRTAEQKTVLHGPVQSIAFLTHDLVMCAMCRPSPDPDAPEILSLDLIDLSTCPASLDIVDRSNAHTTLLLPQLSNNSEVNDPEIAIRTDYSPSYALASQHPRPFTTAAVDRLVVVTIKAFHTDLSFALFMLTSTLLDLAASRPQDPLAWGSWGPARTRMLRVDLSDVWFCYVHGMRAVVPSSQSQGTTDVLDFNQRALRKSLYHRSPDMRLQRYLIGATRVDEDEEMFERPVDTALPCRIQSFETPGLVSQENLEFMLSEDGLVLIQDDHKFKVFSF